MKKFLSLILFIHYSFNLLAKEQMTSVRVFVNRPDDKKQVILRNAKEDIVLDFSKLDKATQRVIINSDPKKAQVISFPTKALVLKKEVSFGIRPNCSEIPTDMDELGEIAKQSKDMVDFLKNIPEGALQGFTFVTNSLSLHRGKKDENGEGQVSPMWPRTLRSSADGKITVSFVCDPKNPTFGKVEIMHFDDKEKEFKMTEFDFGHPSGPQVKPQDRIHKDPVSCISCHAGSEINGKVSLKPNWSEYFQWSDCKENRGIQMYGGNDDNMGTGQFRSVSTGQFNCYQNEYQNSTKLEQENYLKFREMQKDNECFNSLPWPKDAPNSSDSNKKDFANKWNYKYYPYAEHSFKAELLDDGGRTTPAFNYALRTNLRFTDTYSHLMSQRIAALLKKNPNYDIAKYLIAMSGAECNITDEEVKELNAIMPKGKSLKRPFLLDFAENTGLKNKDWTMEFRGKDNRDYNAGIPGQSGDLNIYDVVQGEILKDIAQDNPVISQISKNAISRGVTKNFGSNFSCIDDLGGGILPENLRNPDWKLPSLCEVLKAENKKNVEKIKAFKENCEDCNQANLPKVESKLMESVKEAVVKLNTDQIARGKKLVEADSRGQCVSCHSASADMLPEDFRFIPSEKDPRKKESIALIQARKNEITKKIEERLIKSKTMPPPPLGKELTDQDRDDVKAYLLSLVLGEK